MRTYRVPLSALPGFAFLVTLSAAACSSGLPTSPGAVTAPSSRGSAAVSNASGVAGGALASPSSQFSLTNGSFTITTSGGDSVSGTYSGTATVSPSGKRAASINLQATGGTGGLQGAAGTLTGDGTGAFTSEGSFQLALRGTITSATNPDGIRVRASLVGNAAVSCSTSGIVITLQGDGTAQRLGDIHGTFAHLVGNAGCSP